MIPDKRLQQLIKSKREDIAQQWVDRHRYIESWAIVDGCLVIYDANDAPKWLTDQLMSRDEDGNTPAFYDEKLRENVEEREQDAA